MPLAGIKAVDTKVLVRLLKGDDPRQYAVAKALFDSESIWIAKTVLLETAWVLESVYGFTDEEIHQAFIQLLGLKNVRCEDESGVGYALALFAQGVDIADAMHVCSRPVGATFLTFDRLLARRAKRAGAMGTIELQTK